MIVLGIPRGGIPVAFSVAQFLKAPLDVFVVRKLGVPGSEELAMGAIATGNIRVLNKSIISAFGVTPENIEQVAAKERLELQRREQLYRQGRSIPRIQGFTAILVDDGLATGATMYAAVLAVRQQQPAKIVVAVPVAERSICSHFHSLVDEVVCAETPYPFSGVGQWYQDFSPTTDEEVQRLLASAKSQPMPPN